MVARVPLELQRIRRNSTNRAWQHANKERLAAYQKVWRQNNPDKVREMSRRNYERLKITEKYHQSLKNYRKKRWKEDVQYRLGLNLRNRLNSILRRKGGEGSAVRLLGCSVAEFKTYIETKFKRGMSWKNWAHKGWHLDHIIPLASFDLRDKEQIKIACHYTNFQPLWARENMLKGSKLPKNL